MAVVNVNGISGINSITAQSNALDFYNSAGNTLSIGASLTGNVTGNVTGNATGLSGTPNITVGTIGATSLVVSGITTVAAGSTAAPSITPTGDSNTGIFFPSGDTIAFGEGGSEALRIDSSGNVGIGTTNPTSKLHVHGSGDISAIFKSTNAAAEISLDATNGYAALRIFASGTEKWRVGNVGQSSNFQIYQMGGGDRLTITSSGNVGIGTDNPTSKLHVNGDIHVTSINNGQLGGSRNVIINGSMVVNQRGFTGSSPATANGAYTTDRFRIDHSMDGVVSAGQTIMNSTVGGNAYADGFNSALHYRVTTADASLSASQYALITQPIEGFNVQGFKKGTANAQQFTLSFWVRSSLTGTYIAELVDIDNTRQVSKSYTIDTANTWEKKTLTFPADTTSVFDNDNGRSLDISWWLAGGSTYTSGTLNTSWATVTNANRAVGQVNFLATAGNNFFLTGVQLEVGSTATEFERRSFGDELELCQRYFCKSSNPDVVAVAGASFTTAGMFLSGTANAYAANNVYIPTIEFPVTMRTTPSTITFIPPNLAGTTTGQWSGYNVGTLAWVVATMGVQSSTATGFGAYGNGTWSAGPTLTYGAWTASAEL